MMLQSRLPVAYPSTWSAAVASMLRVRLQIEEPDINNDVCTDTFSHNCAAVCLLRDGYTGKLFRCPAPSRTPRGQLAKPGCSSPGWFTHKKPSTTYEMGKLLSQVLARSPARDYVESRQKNAFPPDRRVIDLVGTVSG